MFYNPLTGDRFSDVNNALKAAGKRAKLARVTSHMFRHTFASRLTRDGVDIVTVKELLGHALRSFKRRCEAKSRSGALQSCERLLLGWQNDKCVSLACHVQPRTTAEAEFPKDGPGLILVTLLLNMPGPAACSYEQPLARNANVEPIMKNATLKLSKIWKSLLRDENQRLVEFLLLISLICFATSLGGLGMISRVDTAFKNIGTRFTSYMQ